MDDALLMRCGQRVRDLDRQRKELIGLEATGWKPLVETLSLDELHRKQMDLIDLLDRVDGDYIGVVECGNRLGLAAEALQSLGVGRHLGGQDLERNLTPESGIGGAPHLSYAAFTDLGGDFVLRKGRSDHGQEFLQAAQTNDLIVATGRKGPILVETPKTSGSGPVIGAITQTFRYDASSAAVSARTR